MKRVFRKELLFSPNESGSGMLGKEAERILIVQENCASKDIFLTLEQILVWDPGALLSPPQHKAWWCPWLGKYRHPSLSDIFTTNLTGLQQSLVLLFWSTFHLLKSRMLAFNLRSCSHVALLLKSALLPACPLDTTTQLPFYTRYSLRLLFSFFSLFCLIFDISILCLIP